MNLLVPAVLFSTLVSSLIISYPSLGEDRIGHLTATFGPPAKTYSVSGSLVSDPTLLCNDYSSTPTDKYLNQIVLIERGVCTFTDKALRAQSLGAVGVIIGGNDDSDILGYMGSAPGYENVKIPTVYVSGRSYTQLLQILQSIASLDASVEATLDSNGEGEGTIGFLSPLPTNPPTGPDYSVSTGPLIDPNPNDPSNPSYPTEPDVPYDSGYTEPSSTLSIVWIIVGFSILVKCIIVTVACRRRYRSKHSSSASSASSGNGSDALLTEGEVNDGSAPVVYATYPAPSRAFTVSSAQADEEGALPAEAVSAPAARPLSSSSLSMYPSIQYTPLMPQATAPSDVYAHDLEKQVIIIRG